MLVSPHEFKPHMVEGQHRFLSTYLRRLLFLHLLHFLLELRILFRVQSQQFFRRLSRRVCFTFSHFRWTSWSKTLVGSSKHRRTALYRTTLVSSSGCPCAGGQRVAEGRFAWVGSAALRPSQRHLKARRSKSFKAALDVTLKGVLFHVCLFGVKVCDNVKYVTHSDICPASYSVFCVFFSS